MGVCSLRTLIRTAGSIFLCDRACLASQTCFGISGNSPVVGAVVGLCSPAGRKACAGCGDHEGVRMGTHAHSARDSPKSTMRSQATAIPSSQNTPNTTRNGIYRRNSSSDSPSSLVNAVAPCRSRSPVCGDMRRRRCRRRTSLPNHHLCWTGPYALCPMKTVSMMYYMLDIIGGLG
jgi:hypothetical protein